MRKYFLILTRTQFVIASTSPLLSLRGAQRRGNLVGATDQFADGRSYLNEIATLRSQ